MKADERIQKLLERSGCPGLVFLNTQEASTRYEDMRSRILYTCEQQYDGSMVAYVKHLVDTIDQLEGALEYVLNERDQLLEDLRGDCGVCAHDDKEADEEPCNRCALNDCWAWRGVPDQKGEKP